MTARTLRVDLEQLLHAGGFGRTIPSRLLLDHPVRDRLPTGIPDVDARLGGGIPAGAMTEWIGGVSAGLTGLVFSLLAGATARDEAVAYMDTDDRFDPLSAERRGIELGRLLWIRCGGRVDRALKAADLIVRAGGFSVLVLDLADTPQARLGRIPFAAYLRLQRAVKQTPTALIVTTCRPLAGTAAAMTVRVQRSGAAWSGRCATSRLLEGIRSDAPGINRRGPAQSTPSHRSRDRSMTQGERRCIPGMPA
jgi:hypothetical protein